MTTEQPGLRQLLRTRAGRMELRGRLTSPIWPLLAPVAHVHRATLARRVRVVAIVGSVGKTTTARAVATVLGVKLHRAQLLNTNSRPALARVMLRVRPWQKRAVFEVGINSAGQMRDHGVLVKPDIVVVTAIASDHWHSLGTLDVTRDEKAHMVRALGPNGVAILNADDPNVRWMASQTRARVVLVGESPDAEVRSTDIKLEWPRGMSFTAVVDGESHEVHTNLLGRHMVLPALSALAVARVEGVPIPDAIRALANLTPSIGRMQILPLANGAYLIGDDFKASEESFEAALDTLAAIPARRRIAVFGLHTEPRGNDSYRQIGRRVGAVVDRFVVIGSSKDLRAYRSGATDAGLTHDQIDHVHTAHEAVDLLRDYLEPADVVLVKGRWQQRLARVGLELAGHDVQCRADPCPFKRMVCAVCPMLDQPFTGLTSASDSA